MNKIVTAIGNPGLNNELRQNPNIEVISNDILYQEGLFEILEKTADIDYIILSETILGEMSIDALVEEIKKINQNVKIVIILQNKKKELEDILYEKGVYKIIYNNGININKVENLKKITKEETKNSRCEIIAISGPNGVGKSIISVNLAKSFAHKKNKILIIDFDILNDSLHTILGVKKNPIKRDRKFNINSLKIKVNRKIDLISATNFLFDRNNKIEVKNIERIIKLLRNDYDVIVIDTTSESFLNITKTILKLCNKSVFVTEANILEIKKAKNLLDMYINRWDINKEKFNIVFNKYDKNSISISLLKSLFCEFNILGIIKYNSIYSKIINRNIKGNYMNKNMREEYGNINKKI